MSILSAHSEQEKVDKELAKERLERAKLAREKEDLWVQHQRLKRLYDDLSRECRTINQKMYILTCGSF